MTDYQDGACSIPDVFPELIDSGDNSYGNFDLTQFGEVCPGSGGGGPSGSGTDERIVRWDGTEDIQDSLIAINDAGQLILSLGDESNPGISFIGHLNSGLFYLEDGGGDSLNVVFDGNSKLSASANDITIEGNLVVQNGVSINTINKITNFNDEIRVYGGDSISFPGISFIGDTNTGIGSVSLDTLDIITGGGSRISVNGSRVLISNALSLNTGAQIDTIRTDVRSTGSATDTQIVTEQGVREALDALVLGGGGVTGSGTDNVIARWDGTGAIQNSAFSIDDTGNLKIGSNNIIDSGGRLRAEDGTTGVVGLGFYLDTNTGLIRITADNLGIVTGGSLRVDINNSRALFTNNITALSNGTSSSCSFNFNNSSNSGITLGTSPDTHLKFYANGSESFQASSTAGIRIGSENNPATPDISKIGDVDTGIRWGNSNEIMLVSLAVDKFKIVPTSVQCLDNFLITPGTISAPAIGIIDDTNTGLDSFSADSISVITGGNERARFTNTPQLLMDDTGVAATPTYSTFDDPDSGVFFPELNGVGFCGGGAEYARFDGNGNFGIGVNSTVAGSSTRVFSIQLGTGIPLDSADVAHLYTRDLNGAGTCALRMVNEVQGGTELTIVGCSSVVTSLSSGTGSIVMGGATNRQNDGFARISDNNGNMIYVAYWNTVTG